MGNAHGKTMLKIGHTSDTSNVRYGRYAGTCVNKKCGSILVYTDIPKGKDRPVCPACRTKGEIPNGIREGVVLKGGAA